MRIWIRIAGVLTSVLLLSAALLAASQLTVQVSSTKIRKEAKFWAPAVQTVHAGEEVKEVGRRGDWIEVLAASAARGWIHKSAVTTKKIHLSGGSRTVERTASADEVALAGKGFTEEVEKEYKKQNRKLDFDSVDRMSQIEVTDEELKGFLETGGLAEWGKRR